MNQERMEKLIRGMRNVNWAYTDNVVEIGHSKCLNAEGAFFDVFITENKKKWSDYLYKEVPLYDFKCKYDKYIYLHELDYGKLVEDSIKWYELSFEEWAQIFKDQELTDLLGSAFKIEQKLLQMGLLPPKN